MLNPELPTRGIPTKTLGTLSVKMFCLQFLKDILQP
jgi:hypothetical protein